MSIVHNNDRCKDAKGHEAQRWAVEAGLRSLGPNAVSLNYAVDTDGVGYWWKVLRCRCIFVAFEFEAEGNPPGGGAPVGAGSGFRQVAGHVTEGS